MKSRNAENYDLARFKLRAYRKAALCLLLAGFLMFACMFVQKIEPLSPLGVMAAVLLLSGLPLAHLADKVERDLDLEATSEVKAFLDGEDPDAIERDREGSKVLRIARRSAGPVLGAVVFIACVAAIVALAALT